MRGFAAEVQSHGLSYATKPQTRRSRPRGMQKTLGVQPQAQPGRAPRSWMDKAAAGAAGNAVDRPLQGGYDGGVGGVDDTPQIRKNAVQGRVYEQQEFSKFSNKANEAVEQITIKTPEGTKIRVDAIGVDKTQEM